jgi:hypothetical protein
MSPSLRNPARSSAHAGSTTSRELLVPPQQRACAAPLQEEVGQRCKESDARSLRGGWGELGNLKTLTYGFTIFTKR